MFGENSMSGPELLLIDQPRPNVRRITLNRPEKRNALSNQLRGALLEALEDADRDPDIRVSILRGAGTCFSSGYQLSGGNDQNQPYYTPDGPGQWPRHVVEGSFRIWDLGKPVIAQVHGYCLAGGSELATACDLVYVAEDAQIGYPPVRSMSPPDMQFHPWMMGLRDAMEMMLTGDSISGAEAAQKGFANRAFPLAELEERVLDIAERVAKIPPELQLLNKRSMHQAMEIMGVRAAIRAGTMVQALAFTTETSVTYRNEFAKGVRQALSLRDKQFGDYRESRKSGEVQ
jgi:enoyl-CoA hydratase